jgi:hypothetical protein
LWWIQSCTANEAATTTIRFQFEKRFIRHNGRVSLRAPNERSNQIGHDPKANRGLEQCYAAHKVGHEQLCSCETNPNSGAEDFIEISLGDRRV